MMKRILALLLALSSVLCLLSGCGTVGEIAGNVLEAAGEELKQQVKSTLEEHKVEVVEIKTATGKINDEGGKLQFYCAALVRTNAESSAADCAEAMGKLFGESGYQAQTGKEVDSEYLVHKDITYSHEDYSEGNLYTVYVYTADVSKIIDLDAITQKLKEATKSN